MYRSGPEHNSPVMGTNHRLQVTIRLYGSIAHYCVMESKTRLAGFRRALLKQLILHNLISLLFQDIQILVFYRLLI